MILIRKAQPVDAETITRFQKAMALETENLELDEARVTKGVNAVFSDSTRGEYFVAENDGRVIASLMITYEWSDWRNAWVWWFQSVYVTPEYRRNGVFRMMYAFVKEESIKSGAAGLRLYVESANVRAQKTYEAMGMDGSHYRTFEWMA